MGDRGPYQVLGISEDASFEEIQAARDRLVKSAREAEQQRVEQAYDSILMLRLRLRQEGKIPVPDRIRYPDRSVPAEPNFNSPNVQTSSRPGWLSGLLDTPSSRDILLPLGIMFVLFLLALFDSGDRPPAWAMSISLLVSLYFLYVKERRFWRSVLLALGGLSLGLLFALAVVQGIGFAGNPSSAVIIGPTLLVMWIVTAFLR